MFCLDVTPMAFLYESCNFYSAFLHFLLAIFLIKKSYANAFRSSLKIRRIVCLVERLVAFKSRISSDKIEMCYKYIMKNEVTTAPSTVHQ